MVGRAVLIQSVRNISHKIQMSQATNHQQSEKCASCKTFFASAAFRGLCSGCFREQGKKEQTDNKTSVSVEDRELEKEFAGLSLKEEKQEQVDRARCFGCRKKTGLLGVECKCGYVFCNAHRLPENHKCAFDHKAALEERLKAKLNKVTHGKVTQI